MTFSPAQVPQSQLDQTERDYALRKKASSSPSKRQYAESEHCMSGDSTPAGHAGTTSVGKILASAITTKSKGPLTGIIELRTEGGRVY
jgi:hypothetical protein